MRNLFRFSPAVIVALALFVQGTSNNLFAQQRYRLGGQPVAPAPAAPAAPAPAAQPAPTTPAPAPTTPSALTEDKVREIAGEVARQIAKDQVTEAVSQLRIPAPVNTGQLKQDILKDIPKPPSHAGWHWTLLVLVVLLGLGEFVLFLILRATPEPESETPTRPVTPPAPLAAGSGKGPAAAAMLLLLISGFVATANAAPTISGCRTDKGEPAFFANDGATTKVVCNGKELAAVKVVTFADSAITTANITATATSLKFDLTVGTGATAPNEPDMSLDGTVVGHPIAILSQDDAGKMDLALRYLRGGTAPGGDNNGLRAMRFIEGTLIGACGEPGKGRCGREFGQNLDGEQMYKRLLAASLGKDRTATRELGRMFANAAEFNAADRVFGDDRFKKAVEAVNALNSAVQAGVTEARVKKIEAEVRDVSGRLDKQSETLNETRQSLTTAQEGIEILRGDLQSTQDAIGGYKELRRQYEQAYRARRKAAEAARRQQQ